MIAISQAAAGPAKTSPSGRFAGTPPSLDGRNAVITVSGLRKSFGKIEAVAGIDLNLRQGEIFGLVGPDGAGKTTTLRLLCGVIDPSGGEVAINGVDVKKDPEGARRMFGYMPQRFSLYGDLTVAENLKFFGNLYHVPAKILERREHELLQAARMEPFRDRLARNLSGGMKQKLALSCTLIHGPKILILDEPTTGVDPVSRRDFWRILYSILREGSSILLSTPYMDEAERCNRIAFMNKGKLLLCDTPEGAKGLLKGDMLELIAEPQREAVRVLETLAALKGIQIFGDRLHLWVSSLQYDQKSVQEMLEKAGIGIRSLKKAIPGLEDVFISMAGGVSNKTN